MTAKEKAKELIEKFSEYTMFRNDGGYDDEVSKDYAKQCALIAVEEIKVELATQFGKTAVDYGREQFWEQVNQELNSL